MSIQTKVETDAKYPEHKKMKAVQEESQTIGVFLDWLLHEKKVESGRFDKFENDALGIESNVELAIWRPRLDRDPILVPYQFGGIESILADYFKIDLKKIEQEKRQMLDELRKPKAAPEPAPKSDSH